ncbi:DUF308 domain-containing protein [Methanobacterium oryzae]|uniref:DUF308 domain-containing protein n=1 Tax=Methanobacterium oryzae TaxID=69540 RepID=UPI003D199FB0
MQKKVSALILIVLGLIVLAFPVLGVIPFSLITGVIVSLVGIGLLSMGLALRNENRGILGIILGIIVLILGVGFIVSPALFSFVAALFVVIAGLLLVGIGIATMVGKFGGDTRSGVIALVLGVIYIIIAILVSDPAVLGTLIGLWLLITGFLMLFQRD